MATKRYLGLVPAFINNVTQVELQNTTITVDPAKQPVFTRKGLAGFVRGQGSVTIEFDAAVPVGGPEFDALAASMGDEVYEIQVPYGAKTITSQGEFINGRLESGVNSPTKHGFTFQGTLNKPQ